MDTPTSNKLDENDFWSMFDAFGECETRRQALEGYLHKAQCEIADLQEAIMWYTGKEAAELLREYRAANPPS